MESIARAKTPSMLLRMSITATCGPEGSNPSAHGDISPRPVHIAPTTAASGDLGAKQSGSRSLGSAGATGLLSPVSSAYAAPSAA